MALEYSLSPSQSLKLNITPQMRQSLYMLQISAEELVEFLQQQAEKNPFLDMNWPIKPSNFSSREGRIADIRAPEETLEMQLLSQLRLLPISDKQFRIARYLTGNLNEAGYLQISLEEVYQTCSADMDEVIEALDTLQSLEPAGVGARTLEECLLLQIRRDAAADPWASEVAANYLKALGNRKIGWIAERLGISIEDVERTWAYIRGLHPRPGLIYSYDPSRSIQADAMIRKQKDGEYIIVMNEFGLPKLSVNLEYRQLLKNHRDSEIQQYIRNHIQAAKGLVHGLAQRTRTLYLVIESIVAEQKEFFEQGIEGLKPMTLQTVADRLNMHESTISRAIQHKHIQTDYGLFELRFFFTSGVSTNDGGAASAESVKVMIKKLIDHENKQHPLSDQSIANLLNQQGVHISRRTVMKYREEMKVLSSRMR